MSMKYLLNIIKQKKDNFTMNGILDADYIKVRNISPDDEGQYFYGYYDNKAFHSTQKLHLCHRVSFMDRLPTGEDACELGVLDLETNKFTSIAVTRSWNFQQGAMLQWNILDSETIIYNDFVDGEHRGVVKNRYSKEVRILSKPLANVSPDGNWGLSVNMSRVYDFRAGYGYCNQEDQWKDRKAPEQDGVFLVNMKTGQAKLIISYAQLDRMYNLDYGAGASRKIVINHITFNKESNRFLFLVRFFPEQGELWKTGLGTSDLEGGIYKLRPYTYASHYHWGKQGNLMLYGDCGEGNGLYVMQDKTQNYIMYDKELFHEDIHCSYSPDGEWLIGDGYQDAKLYRPVYLYHIKSGKGMVVGRFYSPHLSSMDIRCDLHCRWSPDGKCASFDSIHEGKRGVYIMDLTEAMNIIYKEEIL